MWVLKSNEDKVIYLTLEKGKLTFGRQNTDVVLAGDSSISRCHCTVHVALMDSCPPGVRTKIGLWLVDGGSKYGTFVQGVNKTFTIIPPNIPKVLQHGSVVRFGILENIWSVEYRPIFVCTSVLPAAAKNDLRLKMQLMNGDVLQNWHRKCSYLVAGSLRLTEKILLALIYGIPIVKPEFVDDILTAVKNNEKFPDPNTNRPDFMETAVRVEDVNLEPGFQRVKLFSGKKFYVENENHVSDFKTLIEAAGGSVSLITVKEKLLENGAALLDVSEAHLSQSSSQGTSQVVLGIREFLEQNHRRVIPSREIALAIAYASVEKMCNAEYDVFPSGPIPATEDAIRFSQCTVIEEESVPRAVLKSSSPCFVDNSLTMKESLVESEPLSAARKRGPSWDVFENQASKKRHISPGTEPKCSNSTTAPILNITSSKEQAVSGDDWPLKRKADLVSENAKRMKITNSVECDDDESLSPVLPEQAVAEPFIPEGWIDMTDRKDCELSPSNNPLSDTIIMLSLVTLAQNYREPVPDARNVKVFAKQNVADSNRTVDLESQPELRDDMGRAGR